jgi:hypothetical protein
MNQEIVEKSIIDLINLQKIVIGNQESIKNAISDLCKILNSVLSSLENNLKIVNKENKEYMRSLIKETLTKPHTRVYGLVYSHRNVPQIKKFSMVAADSLDKAVEMSDILLRDGSPDDFNSWFLESNTYIDLVVPESSEKNVEKPDYEKYILNLKLARDTFANNKEKVVLDSIIEKIRRKYGRK